MFIEVCVLNSLLQYIYTQYMHVPDLSCEGVLLYILLSMLIRPCDATSKVEGAAWK